MKKICIFISLVLMAVVLGVNVYTSIIDARSWSAHIPDSIVTAREYFKTVNPGTFFRKASPLNQLFALATLVVCWKSGKKVRLYFGLALLVAVLTDVFTFAYFYPRNDVLFVHALSNADVLTKTCSEWRTMNWVRSLLLAFGLVCSMKGRRVLLEGTIGWKRQFELSDVTASGQRTGGWSHPGTAGSGMD